MEPPLVSLRGLLFCHLLPSELLLCSAVLFRFLDRSNVSPRAWVPLFVCFVCNCCGASLSSVMGPASPGRAAVPPDASTTLAPVVPRRRLQCPRRRHRPAMRSRPLCCAPRLSGPLPLGRALALAHPAPLPKRAPRAPRRSSSVASSLRGSVALAESGLVTGLATKSCPPVPPPQLRLSRVARALQVASTESQPSAAASGPSAPPAPAPEDSRAAESPSNSDDEWDALLDAHGLAGTAATVAQPAIAAGASRRARDKRRRRQRKAAKRSMWSDIKNSLSRVLRVFCRRGVAGCGFRPGYVHTSEGLVEVPVDAVFSCGSGAGLGLPLLVLWKLVGTGRTAWRL